MKKVTNAELEKLQTLNTEFSKTRLSIGDLELSKMDLVKKIEVIKTQFTEIEKKLIKKYGEDSVINMQTGELTNKK
jgi:hypothetical protein|tara:strand:- start:9 stop:236 length:228 start_codon:yes stop_codon:yes gene_type:complete